MLELVIALSIIYLVVREVKKGSIEVIKKWHLALLFSVAIKSFHIMNRKLKILGASWGSNVRP